MLWINAHRGTKKWASMLLVFSINKNLEPLVPGPMEAILCLPGWSRDAFPVLTSKHSVKLPLNYHHQALPLHPRMPLLCRQFKNHWLLPLILIFELNLKLCSLSHHRKRQGAHRSRKAEKNKHIPTGRMFSLVNPRDLHFPHRESLLFPLALMPEFSGLTPAVHSKPTERRTRMVGGFYHSLPQLQCLWILCQYDNTLNLNY